LSRNKTVIGIDFGTTKTAIAQTTVNGRFVPEIIEFEGRRNMETVMRLDLQGKDIKCIGIEAWDDMRNHPDTTFCEFKPKMGTSHAYRLPGNSRTLTALQLAVLFLKKLREMVEMHYNGATLDAEGFMTVIGYPAEWNKAQRKETIQAAEMAGFPSVIGCEEPVAVVYYHHYKEDITFGEGEHVLVYDIGGGTTDIASVEIKKGAEPNIRKTGGEA
jgi:molecular chaperone DnaK